MTTRQITLIGLLAILVLIGIVAVIVISENRPGVTKANFQRIEEGMTREEVVRILEGGEWEPGFRREGDPRAWDYCCGEDGSIGIGWLNGRVAGKEWNTVERPMIDRLLRSLRIR